MALFCLGLGVIFGWVSFGCAISCGVLVEPRFGWYWRVSKVGTSIHGAFPFGFSCGCLGEVYASSDLWGMKGKHAHYTR